MISFEDADKANNFIRDNAKKFAAAKAARIQLTEYRKSLKAILMNDKLGKPQHERESYAYSRQQYLDLLEQIREAVIEEETIKWQMTAANNKVEMWRSINANNRMQDNVHR